MEGRRYMLEKVIIKNFRSFREETTIDFSKTNNTILPRNVAENDILKGTIFVGANASGKSNIIEAIKVLLDLLFLERNINQSMFRCLFSQETKYSLDYYFKIDDDKVRYKFEVDDEDDTLYELLEVNHGKMMERSRRNAISYIIDSKGIVYDENDIDDETLFLRTLYFNTKFAGNEILKDWMFFLNHSVYINLFRREMNSYGKESLKLDDYLKEVGTDKVNHFFKKYNFEQFIEYGSESHSKNFFIKNMNNKKMIFFRRKGLDIPIPFDEESMGNQNLLYILPAFLQVVEKGGLLLVDEFSSGFHNNLESFLIRLFMEHSENGQMIFVSHSTNLLSNSILRADQEYSVEFYGEKGSIVKRFSEENPRSAQNIERMYMSGVFGGIPHFKEERDAD